MWEREKNKTQIINQKRIRCALALCLTQHSAGLKWNICFSRDVYSVDRAISISHFVLLSRHLYFFVLRFSIQFLPRAFVCCLYILFYNIFEWFVHLLYILFQCCWFSVVGNVADEEDLISRLCSLNICFF